MMKSLPRAEVAELADAHDSGSCARKGVGVRVPPSAPTSYAMPTPSLPRHAPRVCAGSSAVSRVEPIRGAEQRCKKMLRRVVPLLDRPDFAGSAGRPGLGAAPAARGLTSYLGGNGRHDLRFTRIARAGRPLPRYRNCWYSKPGCRPHGPHRRVLCYLDIRPPWHRPGH